MHPFYDRKTWKPGELVEAKEGDFPPTPTNPTGKGIPAFDDQMHRIGVIQPGTRLIVFHRPQANMAQANLMAMFVEVLAPELGRVWVRACDVQTIS